MHTHTHTYTQNQGNCNFEILHIKLSLSPTLSTFKGNSELVKGDSLTLLEASIKHLIPGTVLSARNTRQK